MRSLRFALCFAACGCLEPYRPPPELEAINTERGIYDPASGPLVVRFSTPIDPATLELELAIDRRAPEGERCLPADALPAGCSEPATVALGPCKADPSSAERGEGGVRYRCSGGAFHLDEERREIALEPTGRLIPYERYALILASGLADPEGHDRGVPLVAIFQVKGELPLAPTDFQPGMFFAVMEIFEPLSTQFHFFFWFAVRPETGEVRAFAADADPIDPLVNPRENRDPSAWVPDPRIQGGATLRAQGQVAESEGGRVIVVHPFRLIVAAPPVEANGAEIGGRIRTATLAAVPRGAREVIEGTMFAPEVILGLEGERSVLGVGRGTVLMFRLHPEEVPPIESLLLPGMTKEEVLNPWR